MKTLTQKPQNAKYDTEVTLPLIRFNYSFKSMKAAKQEAIRALMGAIEDKDILNQITVKKKKK